MRAQSASVCAACAALFLVAAPAAGAEEAPDFQLKALRFYDFGLDDRDITKSNAGELYKPVRLRDFRDKREVALIIAEPGWKALIEAKGALDRFASEHANQAQFLLVVIRSTGNGDGRSELARLRAANNLVSRLGTKIPCVIDGEEDPVRRAYAVEGGRVVLVDREGGIAFRGASGQLDLGALAPALSPEP